MNKPKNLYQDGKKLLVSSFTAATLGLMGAVNQKMVKAAKLAPSRKTAINRNKKTPINIVKLRAKKVKTVKQSAGEEIGKNQQGGTQETYPTLAQDNNTIDLNDNSKVVNSSDSNALTRTGVADTQNVSTRAGNTIHHN
ncbi:hypothetical protein EQ500_02090 [Lactobacillus sp. XV13L]|nr:hypothetical protein [Lactobacillus sp. XV13L]